MEERSWLSLPTMNRLVRGVFVLMILLTVATLLMVIFGKVVFHNPLPPRMLDYKGWMALFFVPSLLYFGFLGLKLAFKFYGDVELEEVTTDSQGREVSRDSFSGWILKLFITLAMPIAGALAGYALAYYIFYYILQVASAFFPYIVVVLMAVGLVWYYLRAVRPMTAAVASGTLNRYEGNEEEERLSRIIYDTYKYYEIEVLTVVALLLYIAGATIILSEGFRSVGALRVSTEQIALNSSSDSPTGPNHFVAEESGVANLHLGTTFVNNPAASQGLYNRSERYEEGYQLYYDEEHVASVVIDQSTQRIFQIKVFTPRVYLDNGIHAGMELRKLIGKSGIVVNAASNYYGEGYVLSVEVDGVARFVTEEYTRFLSEQGLDRCYNEVTLTNNGISLKREDVKPNVKIEYMWL